MVNIVCRNYNDTPDYVKYNPYNNKGYIYKFVYDGYKCMNIIDSEYRFTIRVNLDSKNGDITFIDLMRGRIYKINNLPDDEFNNRVFEARSDESERIFIAKVNKHTNLTKSFESLEGVTINEITDVTLIKLEFNAKGSIYKAQLFSGMYYFEKRKLVRLVVRGDDFKKISMIQDTKNNIKYIDHYENIMFLDECELPTKIISKYYNKENKLIIKETNNFKHIRWDMYDSKGMIVYRKIYEKPLLKNKSLILKESYKMHHTLVKE